MYIILLDFFKACECKEDGSVDENCDINGKCSCKPNVCGDKCDKCCPGYNNYPDCDECACTLGLYFFRRKRAVVIPSYTSDWVSETGILRDPSYKIAFLNR